MHQGQICMSVEKVTRPRKGLRRSSCRCSFERAAKKLKVGDPTTDKSNVIGPLINDKQARQIVKDAARRRGHERARPSYWAAG
jgi:acyl-CoA reductase-like NAD-dependent aldehyde dehydrogenase